MSTHLPPSGPEVLDSGAGGPIPPSRGTGPAGRRTALVAGGALIGLAAVGAGGYFAWSALFGVGHQPAQALPASTVGYVALDADPSGAQKIAALRTLNKFPGIENEIGLTAEGDLKRRIFEEIQDDGVCESLDYEDDVESWLGDRFAVAAVDVGDDEPAPVFVLQITDPAAADEGMTSIQGCAGEDGGWVIEDGWAIVAETSTIAEKVAAARDEGTLAEDADFLEWTGNAGDPGILTAYAAPAAGAFLTEAARLAGPVDDGAIPDELLDAMDDFDGAGVTVRFDDGSLEVESASSLEIAGVQALTASDDGAEVISTLPAGTAAALGVGFEEGWFTDLLEVVTDLSGGQFDLDEVLAEIEREIGLSLPESAETLAGESLTLVVGADIDADTFFESADGSDVPVGIKIEGDAGRITDLLDQLADRRFLPDGLIGHDEKDGFVVVGPNPSFREEILGDGALGETDLFTDVIREDDLSAVLFVNFDAGDNWLAELVGDDEEVRENIEPLAGLGLSVWSDDGVAHSVLRITTD